MARDLTPGDCDSPGSPRGQDNYAFSPDGKEICYGSDHDKNEADSTNSNLWIVPVSAAGQPQNITADNLASDSMPLYSPNGRYIAYFSQRRPGMRVDLSRLILYDRQTGEKTTLTDKFDRWVGTFIWAPYSQTIYFTTEDNGQSLLYSVSIDAPGVVSRFMSLSGFEDNPALSGDGTTLLFAHMSVTVPNELYRADVADADARQGTGRQDGDSRVANHNGVFQLTRLNDAVLSQLSMSPLESFWFAVAHGDRFKVSPETPELRSSANISSKILSQRWAANRVG